MSLTSVLFLIGFSRIKLADSMYETCTAVCPMTESIWSLPVVSAESRPSTQPRKAFPAPAGRSSASSPGIFSLLIPGSAWLSAVVAGAALVLGVPAAIELPPSESCTPAVLLPAVTPEVYLFVEDTPLMC